MYLVYEKSQESNCVVGAFSTYRKALLELLHRACHGELNNIAMYDITTWWDAGASDTKYRLGFNANGEPIELYDHSS